LLSHRSALDTPAAADALACMGTPAAADALASPPSTTNKAPRRAYDEASAAGSSDSETISVGSLTSGFEVRAENSTRPDATVLTVRGPDVDGVLASMIASLTISGCKLLEVHAKTRIFEDTLEDTFVVQVKDGGGQVTDDHLQDVSQRLLAATKDPLQARSPEAGAARLQHDTSGPAPAWEDRGTAATLPRGRRLTLLACKNCQKARTACTDQRPCQRCTRLGLQCEGEAKPVRRACDQCKRAKTKCDLNDAMPCARCVRLKLECTAGGSCKRPPGLEEPHGPPQWPVACATAAAAAAVQAAATTGPAMTATAPTLATAAAPALAVAGPVAGSAVRTVDLPAAACRDSLTAGEAAAALDRLLDQPPAHELTVDELSLPALTELALPALLPLDKAASPADPAVPMEILSDEGLDAFLSAALGGS